MKWVLTNYRYLITLRPIQNGRYFPDDIFECIFLKENIWIPIKISLRFVPKSPINNIPALVQIMAWRWPGDKPLSEPMLVRLPTHICVTWPQWVILFSGWAIGCLLWIPQESFWVWAQPIRGVLLCNTFSHWLSPYPKWSLFQIWSKFNFCNCYIILKMCNSGPCHKEILM